MPRVCQVCSHPERKAIEQALFANGNYRAISALYRVTDDAVARHKKNHLAATLVQAQQAAEVVHAGSLLDQISELKAEAWKIKDAAEKVADYKTALMGIRELTRIIELLAKLQGELQENQTVNVLVASPDWLRTRTTLLQALQGFPDARQAVVRALQAINDR